MKKILQYLLLIFALSFALVSCQKDEAEFDETLLYGEWRMGTLHEKYNSDGSGLTWNTGDDVSEEEGQKFTWTLVSDNLTQIHIMEIGGKVPKYYTVTTLTATTLSYKDDFGTTKTFTKVK